MKFRSETLLNLVIVVVLAVDAFIALQIYQQRLSEPEPVATLSLPASSTTAGPATTTEEPDAGGTTSGTGAVKAAAATATAVNAKAAMQSAVLTSELTYVESGAMPANSFALEADVPGARFVDGVNRADVGIIGIERTDGTILLVTALSDGDWICAAVDGQRKNTTYGRGTSRDAVGALSSCTGSQDLWS